MSSLKRCHNNKIDSKMQCSIDFVSLVVVFFFCVCVGDDVAVSLSRHNHFQHVQTMYFIFDILFSLRPLCYYLCFITFNYYVLFEKRHSGSHALNSPPHAWSLSFSLSLSLLFPVSTAVNLVRICDTGESKATCKNTHTKIKMKTVPHGSQSNKIHSFNDLWFLFFCLDCWNRPPIHSIQLGTSK